MTKALQKELQKFLDGASLDDASAVVAEILMAMQSGMMACVKHNKHDQNVLEEHYIQIGKVTAILDILDTLQSVHD